MPEQKQGELYPNYREFTRVQGRSGKDGPAAVGRASGDLEILADPHVDRGF